MAMQTGIGTTKLIILVVGAGVTGQVLGREGLSDILKHLQKALSKDENGDSSGQSFDTTALHAQVARLTEEFRHLYRGRQITVVNGGSDQSNNLGSYIIPIMCVGAAGYCYMWWKGLSLSDLMYVTKRNMANAVSNVTKHLEQVSSALAAAKKQLTQRMERLNEKLDEQKEVTGAIRFEVGEVREDLAKMGLDISSVHRLVEGLETKIDTIEGKQDLTNAGVVYLCHFVHGLAGSQKPELLQSFSGKARLERSPSSAIGLTGLKELQYFTEALQPKKSANVNDGGEVPGVADYKSEAVTPGGTIHRTMKFS